MTNHTQAPDTRGATVAGLHLGISGLERPKDQTFLDIPGPLPSLFSPILSLAFDAGGYIEPALVLCALNRQQTHTTPRKLY